MPAGQLSVRNNDQLLQLLRALPSIVPVITYAEEGAYVFGSVCFSVCLFVRWST